MGELRHTITKVRSGPQNKGTLKTKAMGGMTISFKPTVIVIPALRHYIQGTKLWFSSAEAYRLPERTAIFYHQNSTVTCHIKAMTFGKGADVIACDCIGLALSTCNFDGCTGPRTGVRMISATNSAVPIGTTYIRL
ncbi:hypothetical protein SAMN04488044_1221 [Cognatishimia maritima]|uniref:Uncharacterized protein n=1 Tax=Cognatishimia maritima TaxID=870908 RepID=A0A1M5LEE5_9RHOB|nr:hypothetical protein SAMN04488044_1221 [Cognatishimia maritima]